MALVLSILSILCCCVWWIGLVLGLGAVILGIWGRCNGKITLRDMAAAGIVVGSVGIALAVTTAVLKVMFYNNIQGL